jgi:uncharacterized protein
MRSFLLLHGLGNRRPVDHWQRWLAEQLRARGERVCYPQFPEPDRPVLTRWLHILAAEYGELGDGERIVVCHSLACALWYQAWATATLTAPADRVLLVAPPGKSVLSRETTREFDPGTWRPHVLAGSSRARIRLVGSDADPNSAEGPAALVYGDPLDLDSETIPAAGHLTPADGYGPWPAVLEWCWDSRVRLSDR